MANNHGTKVYFNQGERVALRRAARDFGVSESYIIRVATRVALGLPTPNDPLRPPMGGFSPPGGGSTIRQESTPNHKK
jgi:hypothetical protein